MSYSHTQINRYVLKKGQTFTWDIGTTADYLYVSIESDAGTILKRTKILKKQYISGSWTVPPMGKAPQGCNVKVTFDNKDFSWYSSDAFYEIRIQKEKKEEEEEKISE